jgi:hypothetical protein
VVAVEREQKEMALVLAAGDYGNGLDRRGCRTASGLLARQDELAHLQPGTFLPGLSRLWNKKAF